LADGLQSSPDHRARDRAAKYCFHDLPRCFASRQALEWLHAGSHQSVMRKPISSTVRSPAKARVASSSRRALGFIEFCDPALREYPPPGNQWLYEIKADGYRAQVHVNGKNIIVYSRSGYDWTDRFPTIAEAARKLRPDHAILDGEAVVMGAKGIPDFQALRRELGRKDSKRITYLAFDLLYVDGHDLRQKPYVERKRELQTLLADAPEILSYVEYLEGDGHEAFRHACQIGFEGLVCKRKDSPYRSGRQEFWIKVKCKKSDDFPIVAFVEKLGARPRKIASLYVGRREGERLLYAGKVGTGYTETIARELREKLDPLIIKRSPLSVPVKKPKATWLKPNMVAEVSFGGITEDGLLRAAVFKRLIDDLGPLPEGATPVQTEKQAHRTRSKSERAQARNAPDRRPTKSQPAGPEGHSTNSRPLLVIDGDSFAHRSYHALPNTIQREGGKGAGAIVGFANFLLRLYDAERPRAVLVGWDTLDVPTSRHERFPAYQSGREFDDALIEQLDVLPEFVAACGFANAKAPGYEADDFLAAAVAAEERRCGTVMVASGDRDTFQLASETTTILFPVRAGEMARIGPAQVRERYGVDPRQVPDFIALRGDPSDKLPGARGVGPKGAAYLLGRYGRLDAILAAGRFPTQVEALRLYRSIATMDASAPLPSLSDQAPTWVSASDLARAWGLNQLADRLAERGRPAAE
jgi:DNA ligase D-like protein (predicted ligase)